MVLLLALPVFAAAALAHRYLQLYAPSNLLIRHVRSQPARLGTAIALAILASGLLTVMHVVVLALLGGAPGWLNLVVLWLAWDAIKIGSLAIMVLLGAITRPIRRLLTSGSGRLQPLTGDSHRSTWSV